MRTVKSFILASILALAAGMHAGALAMELGQAVPPLAPNAEWVQGAPVSIQDNRVGRTLVTFWYAATPETGPTFELLQQLALRHAGLTVIAITPLPDDTPAVIQEVLHRHPAPNVRVVRDAEGGATLRSFYPQTQQVRLPFSFLVGADGRLLWSGSPLSGLTDILREAESGQWTLARAIELQQARAELEASLRSENPAASLLAVRKIARLEKGNPANFVLWHRLATQTNNHEDYDAIYDGWAAAAGDSPEMLLLLANTAMSAMNPIHRRPLVAYQALTNAQARRAGDPRFAVQSASIWHRMGNIVTAREQLGVATQQGSNDPVVRLEAAQLICLMFGPGNAVQSLEALPPPPGEEWVEIIASHLSYYRTLAQLGER